MNDMHKEVIEKVLECIRDLCDEMGPGAICDHIEWIVSFIETLLDKTALCQTQKDDEGFEMNGEHHGPRDDSDDDESDDDEDLDHDELILGNATDLCVSLAKCMQDAFLPYLQRLGPKLVKYLADDHPKSDKIMVIGCLGETFNQVPASMPIYFNDFMGVLLKHSTSSDGSLNRNVSYGIAILADKAAPAQFEPQL